MAKPNYQYEKRQRDLAKKQKQEEKRRQKLANKAGSGSGQDQAEVVGDSDEGAVAADEGGTSSEG